MGNRSKTKTFYRFCLVLGTLLYICVACERTVDLIEVSDEEVTAPPPVPAEPDGVKVKPKPLPEIVLETFQGEVGVKEVGDNEGERVEEYLASTGLDGGYAWCAAFVSWGFTQHGISTPQSAWSPAWFPDSNVIYYRKQGQSYEYQESDVIGIWFRSLGRIAHVGIVESANKQYIVTIEGNTNEGGSRTGDAVHRKRRLKRQVYAISRWIEHPSHLNPQ